MQEVSTSKSAERSRHKVDRNTKSSALRMLWRKVVMVVCMFQAVRNKSQQTMWHMLNKNREFLLGGILLLQVNHLFISMPWSFLGYKFCKITSRLWKQAIKLRNKQKENTKLCSSPVYSRRGHLLPFMRHTGTTPGTNLWNAVDEDHGGGTYTEGSLSSLEF